MLFALFLRRAARGREEKEESKDIIKLLATPIKDEKSELIIHYY